ncbi:hypothetical protein ACEWY4_017074 [Coilia grayii]|uniref:LITAF domain-containing protein n=1 Tax=Coilia grayii TaxID=363190 RepID=A0ABD1JFT0_9TELE
MGDPEQTKDITHMKAGGSSVSPGQEMVLSNQPQPPPPYPEQASPPSMPQVVQGGPTVFPGQAVTLSNQQPSPPPYLAQAPPPSLAVQPAQPYAQPQVVMTTQGNVIQMAPQPVQVAAQQPTQVIICAGDLGDVPTTTMCRNCGQRVQTRVVYHSGAFTWLICGLCILFG